jgi:hypothetical protein
MVMEIVPATARGLEILTVFADKSSSRPHARGADQSCSAWPSEDLIPERVLGNIRAGETFIVWDDGGAAATIAVDCGANPTCGLGEAIEAPLYAHKRILARGYGGRGMGADLLGRAGPGVPRATAQPGSGSSQWSTRTGLTVRPS